MAIVENKSFFQIPVVIVNISVYTPLYSNCLPLYMYLDGTRSFSRKPSMILLKICDSRRI